MQSAAQFLQAAPIPAGALNICRPAANRSAEIDRISWWLDRLGLSVAHRDPARGLQALDHPAARAASRRPAAGARPLDQLSQDPRHPAGALRDD
ncbi:MAG: hypothetical protein ACYDD1_13290 [Caulobacteraceae bacterium]